MLAQHISSRNDITKLTRNPNPHNLSISLLHQLPLPTPRKPIPPKKQHSRLRTLIQNDARLRFAKCRQPPKFYICLGFCHVGHLVDESVYPGLL